MRWVCQKRPAEDFICASSLQNKYRNKSFTTHNWQYYSAANLTLPRVLIFQRHSWLFHFSLPPLRLTQIFPSLETFIFSTELLIKKEFDFLTQKSALLLPQILKHFSEKKFSLINVINRMIYYDFVSIITFLIYSPYPQRYHSTAFLQPTYRSYVLFSFYMVLW